MEGVEHGNRRGVMVAVRHRRVIVNQLEIQIPAARRGRAGAQTVHCPRRHGHRRQARWTAQPLLRATVGNVDAGLVELYRHSAERGDAIRDHQSASVVRGGADGLA